MSLDQFNVTVEAIAFQVWTKFGPEGWATAAAYEEIKAQVTYNSWIVSDEHARQVLVYTKYGPSLDHLTKRDDKAKRTTRADAAAAMIHAVEDKLQKIVTENEVFYWQVKFTEIGRFLMAGEIDSKPVPENRAFKEALSFCTEIEAEEAAEEFCQGYAAAGLEPPKIHIVGFNASHKEIPKAKLFIGPAVKKPDFRQEYPMSEVPNWCRMPPDEQDGNGGCWGIASGDVARKGKDHCETCEYLESNNG